MIITYKTDLIAQWIIKHWYIFNELLLKCNIYIYIYIYNNFIKS